MLESEEGKISFPNNKLIPKDFIECLNLVTELVDKGITQT